MKKPISLFLAASIAIPTMLTAVSGCVNASADDKMTNGELLELINNKFGFEGYESSESYYESIPSGDAYFEAVQTAHEFEVLDELVTDFKTDEVVTREFFAMAASGAIYNDYADEVSISDISDITYKDDVLTVLNYGIMELNDGKFEPKKTMSGAECILLLDAAFDIWTKCSVVKPKYDVQLNEGVIDLGGAGMYYYDEAACEMKFDTDTYNQGIRKLESNNYSYDPSSDVVKLDSVSDFGIEVGSVMTLPTGDKLNPYAVAKVASIEKDNNGQYSLTTVTPEMEELFKEYSVEQTITPDFSNVDVIYDMNGNPIMPDSYSSENVAGNMAFSNSAASGNYTSNGIVTCANLSNNIYSKTAGKEKKQYSFEHKDKASGLGVKIGLSVSSNSFSISTTGSYGDISCSASKEIKNINIDYRYDFWKGYAKIVLKNDYVTKMSAKGSIKVSVPICTIPIPTGIGDLTVDITPKLNIGVDGSVSISFTNEGIVNGLEYRRGHGISKVSNSGTRSLDAKAEVKIEASLGIDVKAKAIGGMLSVGIQPSVGVGAIAKAEVHKIDIGEAEPLGLSCADIKFYPILKVKVYGKIKFFFGEIGDEFEWTALGEKNTIFELHLELRSDEPDEGMKIVPECTKDDLMNVKKDKETEQAGVTVGEGLKLTETEIRTDINAQFCVGIAEVPSGYNYEDIYVKVSNSDVLEINSNMMASHYEANPMRGTVNNVQYGAILGSALEGIAGTTSGVALDGYSCSFTGKEKGETTIKFVTKDGKYEATCEVIVFDPNEPLDLDVKLDTYGVTIGENTCYQFNIVRLPWFLTEDDIVWETSDPSIVTVGQNGMVTAVGSGYAMITASTPDGTSKAYCNITVNNVGRVAFIFIPGKCVEYQL